VDETQRDQPHAHQRDGPDDVLKDHDSPRSVKARGLCPGSFSLSNIVPDGRWLNCRNSMKFRTGTIIRW
jgi:hypothetical protein